MLENVSGSEIHTRIMRNVITKSIVNRWVQKSEVAHTSISDELFEAIDH